MTSAPRRRESERLLALHQASMLLAAQPNPEAVLQKALQSAVALLGAGSGTFYQWDAEAGLLRCVYNWRVPENDTTPDQPPGVGLAGQAFVRLDTLIVNDYLSWEHAMPSGVQAGLRAALSVPLIRTGAPLGVVVIRSYDDKVRFTEDDAHLLGLFGDQAAIAIENAHLYSVARQELAERKRAEEARHRSEERYRELFDNANDTVYTHDLAGNFTSINRAGEQLLGYTGEEVLARRVRDVVVPEHRAIVRRMADRALAGETLPPWELEIVGKDGRRIPLELNTRLIYEGGNPVGVQGIARDITERKRAEAVLRKSEARHRAVVDTAFDGIVTATAEGIIQSFNRSAERIFGYSAEEVIGQPLTLLMPERFRAAHTAGMGRYLATGQGKVLGLTLELAGQRKGGAEFPLELFLSEIREEDPILTASIRNISERKAFEGQLQHQAFHDPLTGLPNRALFANRLEHALARAARHQDTSAVLFLDLDRFKVINDSLGHELGDHLLIAVARRLERCVRPEDTVARLGGDEFTVLLEELTDSSEATRVAERITQELRAPFTLGNQEIFVTTSIGIALSTPEHNRPADLLREADLAMYRAKRRGKACYEVFDQSMNTRALERLGLETALRRAIERGEMRVYYQPTLQLETGRIVGLEALVRWDHPERGLVSPAEFIPLAEETGLILPLGRWVMAEACRQTQEWHARYPSEPPLTISVNLSARQLGGRHLLTDVVQVLHDTGLEPCSLQLEITESVVMEDPAVTIATLRSLKELGVRLAIDDFGTGYSSLSYLRRFPVDLLKVDKSFVDGLGLDPEDTAIVRAVITLAHALGLQVIAEGVESAAQLAHLRGLRCELGQGYYFAPPLPGLAIEALLTAGRSPQLVLARPGG